MPGMQTFSLWATPTHLRTSHCSHLNVTSSSWWFMLAFAAQLASCEESMMTLPLDVYRIMSRHQATFLDAVSSI